MAINKRLIATEVGGGGAACTTDTLQILGDSSCVAYYKMADATDESGSYNGTPSNVNFNVQGKYGLAGEFNGSNSNIAISATNSTPVDFSNENFTISAWINGSGFTTDDRTIISKYSGSNNTTSSLIFDVRDNDQKLRVSEVSGTSVLGLQSAAAIPENTWTHVVYVRTATTCEFFINGSSSGGAQSRTNSINQGGNTNILIGERQANKRWIGKIDQVRIFNKAITSTEVSTLYNEVQCVPTITPSEHFSTVTYDGTGVTNLVTGVGFAADFIWFKGRDYVDNHLLIDSVRGINKVLLSNSTLTETTTTGGSIDSINNDGYTLQSTPPMYGINISTKEQVAWNWYAPTSETNNAGSNGATIASTIKKNVAAGFSIVKYTGNGTNGATVAHGLTGLTPQLILIKQLTTAGHHWKSIITPLGAGKALYLNLNIAVASGQWNNTLPTTSVFTLDNDTNDNESSQEHIAYCFANISGYSRIGSYLGTDAPNNVIVTNFEPAFLMIKSTGNTNGEWIIFDNKRNTTNPRRDVLKANSDGDETTEAALDIDFTTNGFILNGATGAGGRGNINTSNVTYIFMAFAQDPDSTPATEANSFEAKTYTGDGGTQSISLSNGMKPDFVWIKSRDVARNHYLYDSIRGANNQLISQATDVQSTVAQRMTGFGSNGFNIGTNGEVNTTNEKYISWNWKAADHDRDLATINQDGSITSLVSANVAAGFSIVTMDADSGVRTVGHGLSSAPELIIWKSLTSSTNYWQVLAQAANGGNGHLGRLALQRSDAFLTVSSVWNNTQPTSTVFTLGTSCPDKGVAYCFHSVAGYQKVGSYTGNRPSTKTVYTTDDGTSTGANGFEPSFLMIKDSTNTGEDWIIVDNKREGASAPTKVLYPNRTLIEDPYTVINFTSNGFTVGDTGLANTSGATIIYLAIA